MVGGPQRHNELDRRRVGHPGRDQSADYRLRRPAVAGGRGDGYSLDGLTDDYPNVPSSQDFDVYVPGAAPNGQYHHVVTVSALFAIQGGLTKTIRMYADTSSAPGYYANVHLTLLFIPTARGTVQTIGTSASLDGPRDGLDFPEGAAREHLDPASASGLEGPLAPEASADAIAELRERVRELEAEVDLLKERR
jgi:hypothetical protein